MIVETQPEMTPEQRKNWEAALRINRETRANPDSPYAGQYLAVMDEKVVAQGKDLDELSAKTKALGLEPTRMVYIEASIDYDRTYNIGGFR